MALAIKQKQVVDECIITGNKIQSYHKFYKNKKTADAASSCLFVIRLLMVILGMNLNLATKS